MVYAKIGESIQQVGGSIPMEEGWIIMQEQRPSEMNQGQIWTAQADGTWAEKSPPSLHEQALTIQLTKREFLKLVLGLTADFPTPITLTMIEGYVAGADDDTRLEWTYANHIERGHPMLDVVSATFGISSEMLDIMFVNKDELLYKIDNDFPLHEEPELG